MNYHALFIQASLLSLSIDAHELAFFAGELGLAMAVICGIGIMQVQAKNPNRPEWYYFVSVWAISVGAAYMFSTAIDPHVHQHLPDRANWFRFGLGVERLLVMVNYYRLQHGVALRLSEKWTIRINAILGFITVGFLVIVFGGFLWGLEKETSPQVNQAVVANDRMLRQNTDRLITIIATLNQRATSDSLEKVDLQNKLTTTTARLDKTMLQLSELTDVVISLKRAINQLGASVERTRRSVTAPGIIKPYLPNPLLPTDGVKVPPTTDKPVRRGRSASAKDISDSLYYAHQDN